MCINWGDHKDFGGGRSVMLAALRIMFYMGIRNVFLVGCDFNMSEDVKYAFEQDRHSGSIGSNTKTYNRNIERFEQLKPHFKEHGFQIFNCTKDSKLKVFPFVEYEDAITAASSHMPVLADEKTEGLYEFKYDKPSLSNGDDVEDKKKKMEKERKKREREYKKRIKERQEKTEEYRKKREQKEKELEERRAKRAERRERRRLRKLKKEREKNEDSRSNRNSDMGNTRTGVDDREVG
jgi:hypothetical protein